MTSPLGSAIAEVVTEVAGRGLVVSEQAHDDLASTFWLVGEGFRAEVFANPGRLFFLELGVRDGDDWRFAHREDTDLYPLKPPGSKHYAIGEEIERDICEFLQALTDGRARIGRVDGKLEIVFPTSTGFEQVTVGRRSSRARDLATPPAFSEGLLALREWRG